VDRHIDPSKYRYIISLGNRCVTAMALDGLGIRKEAFPFDYVNTQPAWILEYLQNPDLFLPPKNQMQNDNGFLRNKHGVGFLHHDMGAGFQMTRATFLRRFQRLFNVFASGEKILLVYTSEADVYNEMDSRYNDNYGELHKIYNYLTDTYTGIDLEILSIHTNRMHKSTDKFHNYSIYVDEKYISDNMETHRDDVFTPYRKKVTNMIREIFTV